MGVALVATFAVRLQKYPIETTRLLTGTKVDCPSPLLRFASRKMGKRQLKLLRA